MPTLVAGSNVEILATSRAELCSCSETRLCCTSIFSDINTNSPEKKINSSEKNNNFQDATFSVHIDLKLQYTQQLNNELHDLEPQGEGICNQALPVFVYAFS